MKPLLISAITAAIVTLCVLALGSGWVADEGARPTPVQAPPARSASEAAPPGLRVTDALVEDGWVDASRTAGADRKPLADAATSVCFLTKVEISGVQGPMDNNSCAIDIDEFTGFWQVTATVEEGGASQVRCNARCLTWGDPQ